MLAAPASRKAQGRSASGRNGGARNTMSSNKDVMRRLFICNELYLKCKYLFVCMRIRSSPSAVCVRSSFEITRPARTQPAEVVGIFAIRACDISVAFIHTVHGGTEPRACLTGLRV